MKKSILIILIVLSIFVTYKLVAKDDLNKNNLNSNYQNNNNRLNLNKDDITWNEITNDGINEELLLKNIDEKVLKEVASELQTLVDEEIAEERKNPDILITEGWTRVFKNERYKKVINIGPSAMKPLYYIIYKSSNAGQYEYICAVALSELYGSNFEWSNSKEFLEKFNKQILMNSN